ncbi:MAG: prepilin peptidase [Thermoguttaceae bacterium]|jgi:leader peptidase (prepilin peptidase)/N-methyltransferase
MLGNALNSDAIHWLTVLWLLLAGAAVGSFLNVVVYRLPAGMSIVRPRSHCPLCLHPIRWFDNLPVLSWALLRGQCRDCRGPISIRYPLVEALTAAMLLALGAVDLFGDQDHLPMRCVGPGSWVGRTMPQQCGVDLYHFLLLCTLLAAALVAIDGARPPRRLFAPVLGLGLLAPLAWPWLHPVAAGIGPGMGPWAGLVDGLAGLAAGTVLGGISAMVPQRLPKDAGFALGAASAGVVLGWQAALAVVLAAAVAHHLVRLAARRWPPLERVPATAWLPPAALAWILAWSRLTPGP